MANYSVKLIDNNRGISLESYHNHLSLYESDLKSLVTYNETEDNFVRRANSWIRDIICDEYDSDNFNYNQTDLDNALRVVFKNLRKDFEQSPNFSAKEEKALADTAKKIADMKASISKYRINDYIWRKFKLSDRYWAWDSFSNSSIAVDCRNQIHAYHDTEKYIEEHLEEFAYLSEEELQKKAVAKYQEMLKARRGW